MMGCEFAEEKKRRKEKRLAVEPLGAMGTAERAGEEEEEQQRRRPAARSDTVIDYSSLSPLLLLLLLSL